MIRVMKLLFKQVIAFQEAMKTAFRACHFLIVNGQI